MKGEGPQRWGQNGGRSLAADTHHPHQRGKQEARPEQQKRFRTVTALPNSDQNPTEKFKTLKVVGQGQTATPLDTDNKLVQQTN